ncbi:hypothetical protein Van01_38090 [Micromonospora andamanensis]|uniref:Cation transporter n=1 Tax=Micromonospora andamanensis TaxID=1287068 RepID=A0ABQ4HY89_9ACTN|nr:hypothetical protein Van01_38090 [Micromonospora andamanensis]
MVPGAVRQADPVDRGQGHHALSPELPVILLEYAGALLGLLFALSGIGLSVLTGNAFFDGIATLCIGVLLVAHRRHPRRRDQEPAHR